VDDALPQVLEPGCERAPDELGDALLEGGSTLVIGDASDLRNGVRHGAGEARGAKEVEVVLPVTDRGESAVCQAQAMERSPDPCALGRARRQDHEAVDVRPERDTHPDERADDRRPGGERGGDHHIAARDVGEPHETRPYPRGGARAADLRHGAEGRLDHGPVLRDQGVDLSELLEESVQPAMFLA
jgi:hypothetical protein